MTLKNICPVAYIDPSQPTQQGQEATLARFLRSIVSQPNTTIYRNWRDAIRAINPEHEFLVYQEQKQRHPTSGTGPGGGPGYDVLRAAPIGDAVAINAARDAMCMRNADGSFTMAGAYYLYDPRIPLYRQRVLDSWAALFASYPYQGGFLDNWTEWNADSLDPVVATEIRAAIQSLTFELRCAFPDKIWVGNGKEHFRGLNGEMVENRLTDWSFELTPHVGLTPPRMDIGVWTTPTSIPTDTAIESQMNIALNKGAWFYWCQNFQHVIWKDFYES